MRTYVILLVLLMAGISTGRSQTINWLSWEEAMSLQAKEPKKIFVDIYTDWCGWCKKMDKDTFQHPSVAAYMAENFYMVKLDGEGKEPITFKNYTFTFKGEGRRGYHELAASLMQGRLSYPTVVFMDESSNVLSPVPGYQEAGQFLKIARYFGDNTYKNTPWKEYDKSYKKEL